jgi:hypothetical protein
VGDNRSTKKKGSLVMGTRHLWLPGALAVAATACAGQVGDTTTEELATESAPLVTLDRGTWVRVPNTSTALPWDAIVVGRDAAKDGRTPNYLCRGDLSKAKYSPPYSQGQAVIPGRVPPAPNRGCLVYMDWFYPSWWNAAVLDYEVLVPSWVPASWGTIPAGSAFLGYESDWTAIYACRVPSNGLVGKIRSGFWGCNVAEGSGESTYPNYEVLKDDVPLTYVWGQPQRGVIPDRAIPAGRTAMGTAYVCAAYYNNGLHTGMLYEGYTGCLLGWGGEARYVTDFYYITADFSDYGNGGAFAAGKFFDVPLYACLMKTTFNGGDSTTTPGWQTLSPSGPGAPSIAGPRSCNVTYNEGGMEWIANTGSRARQNGNVTSSTFAGVLSKY